MHSELDVLTAAFAKARRKAVSFAERHNRKLPAERCPRCSHDGHVPGLRCPACGYRHHTSWAIIRDTEFGYDVVALNNRKDILAMFEIEPQEPGSKIEFRG